MNFLIVDDSYLMREVFAKIISKERSGKSDNIFQASDGTEALEIVKKDSIDLLLIDWNLPYVSGLDLVVQLREMKKYKKTPVIMISSEQEQDKISDALSKGVTEYITKPVTPQLLKEKIKKYMD